MNYYIKQALRTKYTYRVVTTQGVSIVVIYDGNGGISVTNNIDNITEAILIDRPQLTRNTPVVYKDTDGVFDGWDIQAQQFVPLNTRDEYTAIALIYLHQIIGHDTVSAYN